VPPLPCLRPYHARINLIWMEECDLANTARIIQSQLSKPPCSSNEPAGSSDFIPYKSFANGLVPIHLAPSRNRTSEWALKKESPDVCQVH
jgi:hypothetical protein